MINRKSFKSSEDLQNKNYNYTLHEIINGSDILFNKKAKDKQRKILSWKIINRKKELKKRLKESNNDIDNAAKK